MSAGSVEAQLITPRCLLIRVHPQSTTPFQPQRAGQPRGTTWSWLTMDATPLVETALLQEALEEALGRRVKHRHPSGTFDADGRWFPDDTERRPCCFKVKTPSKNFSFSLLDHCRSIEHVAQLYGVPYGELREQVITQAKNVVGVYYMPVAEVDGDWRDVETGIFQFHIGTPAFTRRVKWGLKNGVYVYATLEEAIRAKFPKTAKHLAAKRVILKVKAEHQYRRPPTSNALAFKSVTPLQKVEVSATDIAKAMEE